MGLSASRDAQSVHIAEPHKHATCTSMWSSLHAVVASSSVWQKECGLSRSACFALENSAARS